MQLKKAERKRQHLRIAITGVTGGGKTFTSLRIAHALAQGGLVGVIDTENGSAQLYAGEPNPDGGVFEFVTIDLAELRGKFSVDNYCEALAVMAREGVKVVVVDSLTHAWSAEGGVRDVVDRKENKFAGWKDGTAQQNRLLQALLSYPGHLVATMRSKMEYAQEGGKVQKLGMAPIQRDGVEYEFTLVLDMDLSNKAIVQKTRIAALNGLAFHRPGKDVADVLLEWLAQAPMDGPTKDGHHHTWAESCKGFCSALTAAGMTYDNVATLQEEHGKRRPSSLPVQDLRDLLRWLRSEEGKAEYFTRFPPANTTPDAPSEPAAPDEAA